MLGANCFRCPAKSC